MKISLEQGLLVFLISLLGIFTLNLSNNKFWIFEALILITASLSFFNGIRIKMSRS